MACVDDGYYCIVYNNLHTIAPNEFLVVQVSSKEHAIAQTRELEATKVVIPQVLEQGRYIIIYVHVHTCMHVHTYNV